jgi:hypothetical protein
MTANLRSLALVLAIVSIAALLAAGCSGDEDELADGTGTPTPQTPSASCWRWASRSSSTG